MQDSLATGNRVEGNFIGTDKNGTAALGNGGAGVSTVASANDNTVGGTVSGAGNRIAHNGGDGVSVLGSSTGNRVLSNSIFSNIGLGIDLGTSGVTNNDTDDPDTGANNLQNFPENLSATKSSSTTLTTITGTLDSIPSTATNPQNFTIECFVAGPGPFAAALDPSGHGEGQFPVGEDTTVTPKANGDYSFACVSPDPQVGQAVTATATNTVTGDTSEFSQNAGVVPGP